MQVLTVTHYFAQHRSGVELIASRIVEGLARRGIPITWVASGPLEEQREEGVRFVPMTAWNVSEKLLGIPYPLWGPLGLARLFREVVRADVVHLHDCLYVGNVFAFLAARLLGKVIVVTQHIGLVPYSSRILRWLMSAGNRTVGRMVLAGADQCVVYSEETARYWTTVVRFRREPLFVPNGVATELFHPLPEDETRRLRAALGWPAGEGVVLFVGRFVEKKGLSLVRRLAQRLPQYRFVLVGWGVERPEEWGLANVQCMGSLGHEELAQYYQAADLLILPSVGEGFPLVIQEAMACGTPVLTSRETARGSAVIAELAFVSELEEEALARKLTEVMESPTLRTARREKVSAFAKGHWDWERCVDRYREILEEASAWLRDPPTEEARPDEDS